MTGLASSVVMCTSSMPAASIASASSSVATHTPAAPAASSRFATGGDFDVFMCGRTSTRAQTFERDPHVVLEDVEVDGAKWRVQFIEPQGPRP